MCRVTDPLFEDIAVTGAGGVIGVDNSLGELDFVAVERTTFRRIHGRAIDMRASTRDLLIVRHL